MVFSEGKVCHAKAIGKNFTLGAGYCPSTGATAPGGSPSAIDEPTYHM